MSNSRQSRNRKFLKKLARSQNKRVGTPIGDGKHKRIKARPTANDEPLMGRTQTAHCGKASDRPKAGW